MLTSYNAYYNPYFNNNRIPDNNIYNKPIPMNQTLQPLQPLYDTQAQISVNCGTVNSKDDMDAIQPQLNVLYIGVNKNKNEIYTKQLNNNGLIDSYIYTQTSTEISKDSNQSILECLERIESKLNKDNYNERNVTTTNATSYEPKTARESDLWDVPTNDAR